MNPKIILIVVVCAATLSGCASTAQHKVAQEATRLGAPARLTEKLNRGGRLTLADIETMSRQSIPDDEILSYLRQSDARYELTTAQIDQMRASGVSDRIIDYLLSTPGQTARRWGSYSYGFRTYGYGHFGHGYYGTFGHGFGGHRGGHH